MARINKTKAKITKVAWQLFGLYVTMFILAWVFKNLARYINAYCTRWVGSRVVADLRAQIFSRLMRQSLKYFGNNDVGQLISRAVNDTAALEYSVTHSVEDANNHIVHDNKDTANKVVPEILHRFCHNVFRCAHPAKNGGGEADTHNGQ